MSLKTLASVVSVICFMLLYNSCSKKNKTSQNTNNSDNNSGPIILGPADTCLTSGFCPNGGQRQEDVATVVAKIKSAIDNNEFAAPKHSSETFELYERKSTETVNYHPDAFMPYTTHKYSTDDKTVRQFNVFDGILPTVGIGDLKEDLYSKVSNVSTIMSISSAPLSQLPIFSNSQYGNGRYYIINYTNGDQSCIGLDVPIYANPLCGRLTIPPTTFYPDTQKFSVAEYDFYYGW